MHKITVKESSNGRGDVFFLPVCACGWTGRYQIVPESITRDVERISARDAAWLRAAGEGKAHTDGDD